MTRDRLHDLLVSAKFVDAKGFAGFLESFEASFTSSAWGGSGSGCSTVSTVATSSSVLGRFATAGSSAVSIGSAVAISSTLLGPLIGSGV